MLSRGRKYTFAYEVNRQYEEILCSEVGIFSVELLYLLEQGKGQRGKP